MSERRHPAYPRVVRLRLATTQSSRERSSVRFRKASLMGTLMAAALSLLIILPAAADEGPGAANSTPYLVSLQQGWNLISIPADPVDPAIGAVLPLAHPAEVVISYQSGEWLAAMRDEATGQWVRDERTGSLTEIKTPYGYWVLTTDSTPLETLLSATNPDPLEPRSCDSQRSGVENGWNLLGVIDADRPPEGATVDADEYFANITWSIAYGFDTATSNWETIKPNVGEGNNLKNGSGYWVWVHGPAFLCP